MKKTVALIFGGKSAEHEVSVRSAKNIYQALDRNLYEPLLIAISKEGTWYRFADASVFDRVKFEDSTLSSAERVTLTSYQSLPEFISLSNSSRYKADIAFPILHGTMGEDGAIQGLFKMFQIPFVGCGIWGSAAGMDKEVMKRLLLHAQIPSARYKVLLSHQENDFDKVAQELGVPFFIKPANAGSSVGVHKIKSAEEFKVKLKDAFLFDHKILAEEFIKGREIECAVLGPNHQPEASLPGEIIPQHEFYSYEAKYIDDNGALLEIPAKFEMSLIKQIQEMAIKTFTAMGCDGLTRVDFFVTPENKLYVNEINTIPGFTKISMYPKMWEATGVSYKDLITKLITLGFEKFERDSKIKTSYLD